MLVLLIVLIATEVYTLRHFRSLVYDISRRSQELPAAARLGASIGALRMQVSQIKGTRMAEQQVKNRVERQMRRMELFDFSKQPALEAYSLFLKKLSDYRLKVPEGLSLKGISQDATFARPTIGVKPQQGAAKANKYRFNKKKKK